MFFAAMRRRPQPRPRYDWLGPVVLALLALLAAWFWSADPAHQAPGHSRVGWPAREARP
jgi:hypothetical protein